MANAETLCDLEHERPSAAAVCVQIKSTRANKPGHAMAALPNRPTSAWLTDQPTTTTRPAEDLERLSTAFSTDLERKGRRGGVR